MGFLLSISVKNEIVYASSGPNIRPSWQKIMAPTVVVHSLGSDGAGPTHNSSLAKKNPFGRVENIRDSSWKSSKTENSRKIKEKQEFSSNNRKIAQKVFCLLKWTFRLNFKDIIK